MLQQQAEAAAAAFVNAAAKRMGNGAGPMVGMAGLGMAGPMGAGIGPGLTGGLPGGGLAIGLGGGIGAGMNVNMGLAPGSPPSPESDGGHNGLSLSPIHYGLDGPMRGRKRGADGPVEKVVERRQRRMIKNRESAARSRARKQVGYGLLFLSSGWFDALPLFMAAPLPLWINISASRLLAANVI